MEIGRREVVGKVHEGETELFVVLVGAELLWNGGSTVSSSSPAFGWTAAVF